MKIVSQKTRNRLLQLSFSVSCFVLVGFAYVQIEEYNQAIIEQQRMLRCEATQELCFSIYSHINASFLPFAKILTFFLLPIIYKSEKYIISSLLTLLSLIVFALDFVSHIQGLIANESYDTKPLFQMTFMVASPFDNCIFILLSILLILQLSILARFIINRFQVKIYLK